MCWPSLAIQLIYLLATRVSTVMLKELRVSFESRDLLIKLIRAGNKLVGLLSLGATIGRWKQIAYRNR